MGEQFFITPYPKHSIENFLAFFSCGWNIWGRVYKNSVIKQANEYIKSQLKITSKINMAEDVLKLFVITMFAKHYSYSLEPFYFYCNNPESITKKISYQHTLDVINNYNTVISALQEIDLSNLPHLIESRKQIISYCKYMIANYWVLHAKSSHKEGLCSHFLACYKSIKYTKQLHGKKQMIIHFIKSSLAFLTFGKIKF